MQSVWPVSKLSTESVGSRYELVTNCVHTADADATKQFRRVGVGGVYWTLQMSLHSHRQDKNVRKMKLSTVTKTIR